MSGPDYAKYYVELVQQIGVQLSLNATAWDWAGEIPL
jgi:hypothetical protein